MVIYFDIFYKFSCHLYLLNQDIHNLRFNSGTLKTFPEYVYLSSKAGVPVEANVIGSAMFILALLIVIAAQFVGRRVKVSK